MDPRTYLLDRFRGDAAALRARADVLRSSPPQPGPDADASGRMADACDDVVAMLSAILPMDHSADSIAALSALIPLLEKRGASASHAPAVRSVYVGAATRIREIAAAQLAARTRDHGADDDRDLDDHTDSDIDDDDFGDGTDDGADDGTDDDADDDVDDDELAGDFEGARDGDAPR